VLRVYRADPNPIVAYGDSSVPQANYLQPPPVDKNFLISPPGSPPVGWEQVKEDPPNATPLADDLMEALRKLQTHERRSSLEVLLDPQEAGVGVYVEDCGGQEEDESEEEDWVYGVSAPARSKWKPIATALPPMRSVTVELYNLDLYLYRGEYHQFYFLLFICYPFLMNNFRPVLSPLWGQRRLSLPFISDL
jgi:Calcipressin